MSEELKISTVFSFKQVPLQKQTSSEKSTFSMCTDRTQQIDFI